MAFLGPNGHRKTNLLELAFYPVVLRSLRRTGDQDVAGHGAPGFACNRVTEGPGREWLVTDAERLVA